MKGNNKMDTLEDFKKLTLDGMKIQLDKMKRDLSDYQYNDFFDFEDHEYYKVLLAHYNLKKEENET